MACFRYATLFVLLPWATATSSLVKSTVSPIEKVIDLLDRLEKDLQQEGKDEAASFEKFACFCKDTTLERSEKVKKTTVAIKKTSASIGDLTQSSRKAARENRDSQAALERASAELGATTAQCAKDDVKLMAQLTDVEKAISGLEDAIKTLKDDKQQISLVALRTTLAKVLATDKTLSKPSPHSHKAEVLLQSHSAVDPDSADYEYHSGDIIDVCKELHHDYDGQRDDLKSEYRKTMQSCDETKLSLREKMGNSKNEIRESKRDMKKFQQEIAENRENLIEAEQALKDDKLYLRDLTGMCEERANDYDQRSSMRSLELEALKNALVVLTDKVKGKSDEVNRRVLLLQNSSKPATIEATLPPPEKLSGKSSNAKVLVDATVHKSLSFLQDDSSQDRMSSFLSRGQLSLAARKDRALSKLRVEGQRLGSLALSTLALRAAQDPFEKVKGLIQRLIERLLQESAAEATKKGFCDTELGKAESNRDFRFRDSEDLSAELSKLEAKEDSLIAEMKDLTNDIEIETEALKETTADRAAEKNANLKTIEVAQEGLSSLNEAILILRVAYKQLAKGASFMQESPVNDADGPGFEGTYHGAAGRTDAIFALLETMKADFDRTLRTTEAAENTAAEDFVEFEHASSSSIAAKTTKKELDTQDLKSTKITINVKLEDLKTNVGLLDSALKELEILKPTCIDTGMSYTERVKKREQEMEALKNALKILQP